MAINESKTLNRLSYLMKSFGISGNSLASALHVDVSLISKWRCGTRKFQEGSKYPEAIAEFFLSQDEPGRYQSIAGLLAKDCPQAASASRKELKAILENWLTLEIPETDNAFDRIFGSAQYAGFAEASTTLRFNGQDGRRMAMHMMNEYHLSCPELTERIIFTTEDGSWFYEDADFMDRIRNQNLASSRRGHTIKIIHPVNRDYTQLGLSLMNWIRTHLAGKTIDYYVPDYHNDPIRYTYVLIPGHVALLSASSLNYTKNVYTWVTNDQSARQTIGEILRELTGKSRPLFDRYYIDDNKRYAAMMKNAMLRMNDRYYYGPSLQFVPISENILTQVFVSNGFSEQEAVVHTRFFNELAEANVSARSRFIIDLQSLEANLCHETVEWNYLSVLFGKRIRVPKAIYREALRNIFSAITTLDAIEAGFIDDKTFHPDLGGVQALVQENISAQFSSLYMNTPFALALEEPSFIIATLEYLKNIWGKIPPRQKDKSVILERVETLLQTV